ncbi:helicase SRCAP-like, partial [Pezoporus occidentalis]|uniref:helicase SRCAP-like n=1 Tax=Pezoporus occidentalis TaxID=407982 RepID=UPI002F906752
GELVSIGQLAALAQRPGGVTPGGGGGGTPGGGGGGGGAKPLTLQLQGSKLTLAAPPLRHLALAAPPRGLPRNVVHLVAAGGQSPLLGPPAQVTLLAPVAPPPPPSGGAPPGNPPQGPPTLGLPIATAQVPAPLVNSGGVVKIVVRPAPTPAPPPPPPRDGLSAPPPPPAPPPRPLLRVLPAGTELVAPMCSPSPYGCP